MKKYKVKQEDEKMRLDKFLHLQLPDSSRSQIQKDIKDEKVKVNDKKVTPHYFLKLDDEVTIKDTGVSVTPKDKIKIKSNSALFTKIKIIAETSDYLVIQKPAGLLVHADEVHQEKTLVDWLLKKYPFIKEVCDPRATPDMKKIRPGIVHRLDRDVAGLMVIPKNQNMFDSLKKQFQTRVVKKQYLALVHGEIKIDFGEIRRAIRRSKKTGIMIAKSTPDNLAKSALTNFKVVDRFKNYTLLKIQIKTGRTHQIRVHLKSIGYSIVGDTLYQTRNIKIKKNKSEHDYLFLTAVELGFNDLKGKWQEFEIKPPACFQQFCKELTKL